MSYYLHMIKQFFYIIILTFSGIIQVKAFDNYASGARSASMGSASVMLPDVWSAQNNQAALAFFNSFALGIHHENRFFLPQNAFQSTHLTIPANFGTFGFTYSFFGYKMFNDTKLGLAYSRILFEKLAAGIQMDMLHTYIAGYGKENKICAEISLYSEPVDNLMIGVHGFNIFRAKYTDENGNYIPTIIRMGAGYRFGEKLILTAETEKDMEKPPVYKGGTEYYALYGLYLMAGFLSNPGRYTFGLGYIYEKIRADFGFMSDAELGFTPHFSMSYVFKK